MTSEKNNFEPVRNNVKHPGGENSYGRYGITGYGVSRPGKQKLQITLTLIQTSFSIFEMKNQNNQL